MIKLYPQKETEFKSNGTVLRNCFSAFVHEESNAGFTAEFEFPIITNILNEKMIIEVPTPRGDQKFRITKIKRKLDKSKKNIQVTAKHITYDLLDNLVINVRPTNQGADTFGKTILNGTQFPHLFTFAAEDIQGTATANYVRRNPIDCLFGNTENSMINLFGGDIERDNFKITLKGGNRDTGFKIEPKRNLVAIEEEIDISSVFTRIYPTFVIQDNKVLELPEKVIDSPYIDNYPHPIILNERVNLSEEEKKLPLNQIEALVREKMKLKFTVDKIDLPKANYKIDFVQLEKTDQYKLIPVLQKLNINDIVTCKVSAFNLDIKAKVIKYKYDALLRKYVNVELGNFKKSLVNQKVEFKEAIDKAIKENIDGSISIMFKNAIDKILGNTGGYQRTLFNPEGLPQGTMWMDTPDITTAKNYIIINNNGIAFGNNGVANEPTAAIDINGNVVAESGLFRSIVTNLIRSELGSQLVLNSNNSILQLIENAKGDLNNSFTTTLSGFQDEYIKKITDVDGKVNLLSNYFRYDAINNHAEIGSSNSDFLMRLSNSMLAFYQAGNLVAYLSNQKLFIKEAVIQESITIGNHKLMKYDTNLTIVLWTGGAV